MKHNKIIAWILLFLVGDVAWSGEIIQPQSHGSFNVFYYGQVGQTFTAEDSQIATIGFYLHHWGGPTTSMTYALLEGTGLSGSVLASHGFTVSNFDQGFFDADFSEVNLGIGLGYTVLVSASDPYVTVDYAANGIGTPLDYFGGDEIRESQILEGSDLTFRIKPIPEPSHIVLFILCGAAMLLWQRYHASTAAHR